MKKTFALVLISLFCHELSRAQTNDTKEALYNMGFGSVFGGIGAVINKKKDEKFFKVLFKGMGQGALGGYLVFESKRLIRTFDKTDDHGYIWPSRLLNSAGNSIMENAAGNRNFWERWHFHVGFNRLELTTKGRLKLKYRFMPLGFTDFIHGLSKGSLDVPTSLKSGLFVFKKTGAISVRDKDQRIQPLDGLAIGNSIVISSLAVDKVNILAHELIHVYQNESFIVLNPYTDLALNKIWPGRKTDKGLWNYLYLDLNGLYFSAAYFLDSEINEDPLERFYEQEAYYYNNRL